MKHTVLLPSAVLALPLSLFSLQAAAEGPATDAADTTVEEVVVTSVHTTRSAVDLGGAEVQKLLPGISPLKAIESLPGVIYETADPWGNNEQNEALVIHGFTTQQLGYTMDGVPLGDQQYGNYNGLSVSRAVISENVSRVELNSGAGSLGVASTSNLGGAIETYSSDPIGRTQFDVRETAGSYQTTRTFARFDFGLGNDTSAYISYLHLDQVAWDFDGHQGGDQVNAKVVHKDDAGRLTLFIDWQTKVEPNEDAIGYGNQNAGNSYTPYTRPFLYPDLAAGLAYLTNGTPPAQYGTNFSNYFSAAQREDGLAYLQYDLNLGGTSVWSNQVYWHNDAGRGIVAGPVNQAGLPGLFAIYFPGQNLVQTFGGTGYEVRTTEYQIHREGLRSTFDLHFGDHHIDAGVWYEYNASQQARRWYPFGAGNDDLTPYDIPVDPAFTQYEFDFITRDIQPHLQDQWQVTPSLLLSAGWKASLQTAGDTLPVQQQNLASTNPQVDYPIGTITSDEWLLPQAGFIWDVSGNAHVFFNYQKNVRQFIPYGAGSNFFGASPWSLGSQLAFDTFKATARPESSVTYELGLRHNFELFSSGLTAIEGQINGYRVDFSDRLLNVATYNFINPNPAILVNVGGVTTTGADFAETLHFGEHLQFYNGVSYNQSKYDSDYTTVAGGVAQDIATGGKQVPLTAKWLYKTILSTQWGPFEAQVTGDYVGRRPVTYLNDIYVDGTFLTGLEAGYVFGRPVGADWFKDLKVSINVTNLGDIKGVSTAVVTSNSGGYQGYPIPPRMFFVTLSAHLD